LVFAPGDVFLSTDPVAHRGASNRESKNDEKLKNEEGVECLVHLFDQPTFFVPHVHVVQMHFGFRSHVDHQADAVVSVAQDTASE